MASPTNSSQNGGIVGVSNTFTPATCAAAKVTSFTASGTFTAAATANVDYLVVAGGGGGGGSLGGGGGAGGYRASGCFTPSPTRGSAVPVIASTAYTITTYGSNDPLDQYMITWDEAGQKWTATDHEDPINNFNWDASALAWVSA